jgi:hypothetical protein
LPKSRLRSLSSILLKLQSRVNIAAESTLIILTNDQTHTQPTIKLTDKQADETSGRSLQQLEAGARSYIMFKSSVPTTNKTQSASIQKINWLMLFREIIAVYSEYHTKATLWVKCRVTDCHITWYIWLPLCFKG